MTPGMPCIWRPPEPAHLGGNPLGCMQPMMALKDLGSVERHRRWRGWLSLQQAGERWESRRAGETANRRELAPEREVAPGIRARVGDLDPEEMEVGDITTRVISRWLQLTRGRESNDALVKYLPRKQNPRRCWIEQEGEPITERPERLTVWEFARLRLRTGRIERTGWRRVS